MKFWESFYWKSHFNFIPYRFKQWLGITKKPQRSKTMDILGNPPSITKIELLRLDVNALDDYTKMYSDSKDLWRIIDVIQSIHTLIDEIGEEYGLSRRV